MTLLVISLIALVSGPLLYRVADRARGALAALDGFVMVSVAGLAVVHLIPHAAQVAGPFALVVALIGFVGPGLVEHRLERAASQAHTATMYLALGGLVVHEFFDGVGLGSPIGHNHDGVPVLAIAVILHRLPIAITIWWLVRPASGTKVAAAVLVALGASTVAGYALGDAVAAAVDARWVGLLEALIAGSLLHVVVHRPAPLTAPGRHPRERLLSGLGALVGLALVIALADEHVPVHASGAIGFANVFTTLALESAPVLLLAFVLAGLVPALLPRASLRWMRTGRPLGEAVRGIAFGLPLPICSCGVIPLYRTLVTEQVPATAAMAFLAATPELGIDSVLLSLPLLGLAFTLVRLGAATLVALVVGVTVGRASEARAPSQAQPEPAARPLAAMARLRAGLRFGLVEVVDHTSPWILVGLLIAALADPMLKAEWIAALPWGVDVALFALIGMPTYVCASGATPLVAVLIHKGVSPGAALAFLLTGPATNLTTVGVLSRLHGKRTALAYAGCIALLGVSLGLAVNLVLPKIHGIALYEAAAASPTLLGIACLAALALLVALSILRQGPRGFVGQVLTPYKDELGDDGHDHHGHDHHGHAHEHAHEH